MKITINIPDFEVKKVKEEFEFVTHKKKGLKEVAKRFAENLIYRYFSTEYLDVEKLEE